MPGSIFSVHCYACCLQWFTAAGFTDIKLKRIGPKWYRGVRRHGLIMGCSVTGVKPKVGRCRELGHSYSRQGTRR